MTVSSNEVQDESGWQQIVDPAMHERVSAAIALIFEHTDPRAIRTEKAEDGSDLRYALYDSEGRSPAGWDLFEGVNPAKESPFRRADYFLRSDGTRAGIAADSDSRRVLFYDSGWGVTASEAVDGLERFAQQVVGQAS
jgi:hypothetical protein